MNEVFALVIAPAIIPPRSTLPTFGFMIRSSASIWRDWISFAAYG
jgi:hypothetical protein